MYKMKKMPALVKRAWHATLFETLRRRFCCTVKCFKRQTNFGRSTAWIASELEVIFPQIPLGQNTLRIKKGKCCDFS